MRRFLIMILIMGCCVFTSCAASGENGLMPSYSAGTAPGSSLETDEEMPPVITTEADGIELTLGAKDCAAYSLGELVNLFCASGFSDIEIIPCELTSVAEQKDKVLAVLVDGDTDFKKAAVYPKNAKIRILYAVFACDTNAVETDAVTETEVIETTEGPQTETVISETEEIFVYVTESGTKYHTKPNCSDMKDPKKLSLAAAEVLEYTPCKRCD